MDNNEVEVAGPRNNMNEFRNELRHIINCHSIENYCNMPDYLLAEMICDFIESVGPRIKDNLVWHGVRGLTSNGVCEEPGEE